MSRKLSRDNWYKKNHKKIDDEFFDVYADEYNDFVTSSYEDYLYGVWR